MLSMALDPFQNWIALGTSLGYHVVWDMRFQLPYVTGNMKDMEDVSTCTFLIFINFLTFSFLPSSLSFSSPLLLLPPPQLMFIVSSSSVLILTSSRHLSQLLVVIMRYQSGTWRRPLDDK